MDKFASLFQDFDVANFLPAPGDFLSSLVGWMRLLMIVGPLFLLGMGAWFFFAPPKEANHSVGFRTYWSMGSVEAWRFSQKLSGFCYMVLGGVLLIVMGLICLTFKADAAQKAVTTALICVGIQLVLVFALWVTLYILICCKYDKNGKPRPKKK